MGTEVTLKNGVWIHETEWAAIQRLIQAVSDLGRPVASGLKPPQVAIDKLMDAYWCWKHSEMDLEAENRAIRTLTSIISELTTDEDDVTLTSVL